MSLAYVTHASACSSGIRAAVGRCRHECRHGTLKRAPHPPTTKNTGGGKLCTVRSLFISLALITATPGATLFEGARVIVDARRVPLENAAFLIDNGRVVKIGKKGSIAAPGATR